MIYDCIAAVLGLCAIVSGDTTHWIAAGLFAIAGGISNAVSAYRLRHPL